MRYKVVCEFCNEDTFFENKNEKPEFCSHCGELTDTCEIIEVEESQGLEENREIASVSLVCQNTGIELNLPKNDRVVICREMFDDNIPGKDYISGRSSEGHCLLEFDGNDVFITDLNSTNGTFLSYERLNCKKSPRQKLINDDILFLGREPFIIKLNFCENIFLEEAVQEEIDLENAKFRCKNCNYVSDKKLDICPECDCYRNDDDWEIFFD